MKKIFVPAGETLNFDELHTDLAIVHGKLKVLGKFTAKRIEGNGVVEADEICCDNLCVHTVIAEVVDAVKIAVRKLLVESVHADEIMVTDYLATPYLLARRVSMTLSDVKDCVADEIIVLPPKKRGVLGMLVAAWWRSLWLPKKLTAKAIRQDEKVEQSQKPNQESELAPAISEDFLDALVDRLEARGFVYDAPCAGPSPLPFANLYRQQNDNTPEKIAEVETMIKKKELLLSAIADYAAYRAELTFEQLSAGDVRVRLMEVFKSTGEVKDCFKFTYQGRDYKRLSRSEKVLAGVSIAELVKQLTGRNYPMYIDDSESVVGIPRPTGQAILCRVVAGAPLNVKILDEPKQIQTNKAA